MLSVVVFLPLVAALALVAVPRIPDPVCRWAFVAVTAIDLGLVVAMWVGYGGGLAYRTNLEWVPSLGIGYRIGVDGLSLPLIALTAGLFLACAIYSLPETRRARSYVALFLFLETASLGLFAALDLILFFLFFDLSIVGMYFVIAGWGHRGAARAALQFFLYTFIGSLALLLGFIGLYLAASPRTFDIVALTAQQPLAGRATYGGLVLLAVFLGLAIKTPTVPFHTWLPPAHTEAPAAGSAILAGVLLKMGTYGFVRIAMPLLPAEWRRYALAVVVIGVVSILYGALVALAQADFKRMIAYTSVNHMGYVLLAVGAAGLVASSDEQARQLAVTGAVTQMVSHGLITGALFLLAGVLYERGETYEMAKYGGLAGPAPRFAAITALAAFASLGLPGFSGFVAEFQVFTGSLDAQPVATAIAVLGIVLTAALFLLAVQRMLLGPLRVPGGPGATRVFPDLRPHELASVVPLLLLALVIGIAPRFLLDVIEPAARTVVDLVAR